MTMRLRGAALAAAAVVLAAACGSGHGQQTGPEATSEQPERDPQVAAATYADEPDTAERAAALETAVAEGRIADLVAPATLDELDGDVSGVLPDGAALEADVSTWRRAGNTAEMTAVIRTDDRDDTFVMMLTSDGQRWLLSYTVPVS